MSNGELALLRGLARCVPPFPHSTALINRVLKPWYLRKPRRNVLASFHGLRFDLDPREAVDGAMLFYPHLYLRRERRWLQQHVRPGDVFVDAGAYLGVFALLAERLGASGIAIEANPETFKRLQRSLSLNKSAVAALNTGVSDKAERRMFVPQRSGNSGGSAFVAERGEVGLTCVPLADLVSRCDVLKLDVEGMEHEVLSAFLPRCAPRVLIVEAFGETEALRLCRQWGYRLGDRTRENSLLLAP